MSHLMLLDLLSQVNPGRFKDNYNVTHNSNFMLHSGPSAEKPELVVLRKGMLYPNAKSALESTHYDVT